MIRRISICFLFLGLALTLVAEPAWSFAARRFKVGIGYIPRHFPDSTPGDWLDMLTKVHEVGEYLLLQTNWRDSANQSGQIPQLFVDFAGSLKITYDYEPMIGFTFFNLATGEALLNTASNPVNDWTNEDAKQKYRAVTLAICQTFQPTHLALGLEVNTYYHHHPEDFARFVLFYKLLYLEIKQAHPSIKVFVTFQLEKMKGIGQRRFGPVEPQWELLPLLEDSLDLAVFTSYPGVEYDAAANMPASYYSEIQTYTSKPVAFSEIGWESDYDSFTEEHQVDFINRFVELTKSFNSSFANWAFMHDINPAGPLTTIGLRYNSGEPKASWAKWKELRSAPRYAVAPTPSPKKKATAVR